ncbi:MAG: PEP/pyruvate-binding domain-containing protein [Parvibaculum sedimenti]|uniref:PEP/pyruvate-binding domain-containing protein n=1 Tax=Parvibaculum sedimenti TaxID=2608632 RepID=UPI003BB5B283
MSLDKHLFFILAGKPMPASASATTMGSKAYGLMRLARLGLNVPPAFVLGTDICRTYLSRGKLPEGTRELLARGLHELEGATGRRFGGERRPLFVSVRSGAPVSMPGMMETVLNIGLTDQTARGFLRMTGNPRQVQDSYRRLVRDFTEVVREVDAAPFDALAETRAAEEQLSSTRDLDSHALSAIAQESLSLSLALTGEPFPQDPMEQLVAAIEAVFRSWISDKAKRYRALNGIDEHMGTAVTVQAMVFGNMGATSGAGVGFTRDPATGENRPYLDFLFNAQGEDVVSGRHAVHDTERLPQRLPAVADELTRMKDVLEVEFHDMQDFEFTVENGRLYLLQTRNGKRMPWAALRMAVDMVQEGLISPGEALKRLDGIALDKLERLRLAGDDVAPLAEAVPASIGTAVGHIAFDPKRAAEFSAEGKRAILVRDDISTGDIEGIAAAEGVLTAAGGRTSHAAVVARQLGKVCLVGCSSLRILPEKGICVIGGREFCEGDELTLDGDAGRIFAGALSVIRERPEAALAEVARWCVETDATSVKEAALAGLADGEEHQHKGRAQHQRRD